MKTTSEAQRGMRLYALLLRLYPAAFRRSFGAQMLQTFRDCYGGALEQEGRAGIGFWLALAVDELPIIVSEHAAAIREGVLTMVKQTSFGRQGVAAVLLGIAGVAVVLLAVPAGMLVYGLLAALVLAAGAGGLWLAAAKVMRRTDGVQSVPAGPAGLLKKWPLAAVAVGAPSAVALGFILVQLGQPDYGCAALAGATTSAPAAPQSAQDWFALGDYDYDRGNCDKAIADYGRAIALKPDFAEAYNNRGYTEMLLKDYAAALPDLDHAIQLRPNYLNALMNRGDIYNFYYQIDYTSAIADYDRVLALGAQAYEHTSLCGHRALALNRGNFAVAYPQGVLSLGASGCAPD